MAVRNNAAYNIAHSLRCRPSTRIALRHYCGTIVALHALFNLRSGGISSVSNRNFFPAVAFDIISQFKRLNVPARAMRVVSVALSTSSSSSPCRMLPLCASMAAAIPYA